MTCPNCGLHNSSGGIFCEDCGYQFVEATAPLQPLAIQETTAPLQPVPVQETTAERIIIPVRVMEGNRNVSVLPEGFLLKSRYRMTFITSGGMGNIYEAIDRETGLKYIIKEAFSPHMEEKEIMTAALLKERDILSRLNHPSIVKAVDLFQYGGNYYLVLEYVQGSNLDNYAKKMDNLIMEKDVISWACQLCSALNYLHNLDPPMIYRDLKPENIMVDIFGRVKLIDFGIARSFKENKSRDTIAIGTPGFAAPEQYGKKQTDHRADIYSLGATMHFLLTGSDPRERKNPLAFPPVEKLNPKVTPLMRKIINKSIMIDRQERYQTAGDMRVDLEHCIEQFEKKLPVYSSDGMEYASNTISNIHPGLISFFLPIITSFLAILSLGMTPFSALSPIVVIISFIAGSILGIKGIVRDIKTQSYGMLIISVLGAAINLLPALLACIIFIFVLLGFLFY